MHMLTGEVCMLLAVEHRWVLRFDDDGFGYVRALEKCEWADDVLKLTLCHDGTSDNEGKLYVGQKVDGCIVIKPLADFLDSRTSTMKLEILDPIGRVDAYAMEFLCERKGFCSVWDLMRLYASIGMTSQSGKAWKWASHSWARWQAYLVDEAGLSLEHLVGRPTNARSSMSGEAYTLPRCSHC